jgi:hypothetical protein
MPTQQEVQFYRDKYQRFSFHKLQWSLAISLFTGVLTAPAELVKTRSQLLQEGRVVHGWNQYRGVPSIRLIYEVVDSGAGVRGLWKGLDTVIVKSLATGFSRTYLWCLIYNYTNPDPRRIFFILLKGARYWPAVSLSNFMTGFAVGVAVNPFEIVYTRQVTDSILPAQTRRNYTSFLNGLLRVNSEGALFRGAVANGISVGLLLGSLSSFYDYLKEYYYYFFGPTHWLRPMILVPTSLLACLVSLPFDNIKTRFHVMQALPDGRMPYNNVFDAFSKIMVFEGNRSKYSNYFAYHTGFASYLAKIYFSLLSGVYMSDYAFRQNYVEGELIEMGDYQTSPYVKVIAHEPYNRSETLKIYLDKKPDKEYFLNPEKTKSFKI